MLAQTGRRENLGEKIFRAAGGPEVDVSRCEPLGVAGEHGGLPDVVQPKVQHRHSFKAWGKCANLKED